MKSARSEPEGNRDSAIGLGLDLSIDHAREVRGILRGLA